MQIRIPEGDEEEHFTDDSVGGHDVVVKNLTNDVQDRQKTQNERPTDRLKDRRNVDYYRRRDIVEYQCLTNRQGRLNDQEARR